MSSEKDYSVLPEVTVIQESAKIESEEHKPKKLRVCAYARVSTEKEEQEYSFENQRDYYMDYISKRSDWEFVGIYSDFGLSGKNKKRPQFIKMIDDCHAGKIDRIITKSISRFARNTIDCIQTVRDLREKGIGVYFEREGIDSLSPQSALVLSIMAIVAEEESRSISNNIKWAIQKQFAQGHYLIHTKHFLGYSREEDNRIIIIPKQALAVRSIYQLYLDGKSIHQIALEMELREIKEQETLIKNLQTRDMVKGKYKKSDELTEQMAEFLVKATVKDWTITFEFQNGYKATKEYTNGRAGNVNGKLCKH